MRLPIAFGDRFVGRIEPRINRGRAFAEVLGVWCQGGFARPRRRFVDAMRGGLRAYLRFVRADASSRHPISHPRSGS